jgi:hypothetical protein
MREDEFNKAQLQKLEERDRNNNKVSDESLNLKEFILRR